MLDLDATDDPLYGQQEGRFFHGYYGHYCYLPLYIFCGGHLLCARPRSSNIDASAGSLEEVERIVKQIRARWPEVRIILRADSGFWREALMRWCDDNRVHYVFGLARNQRLRKIIDQEMAQARSLQEQTQQAARLFSELSYRTHDSWSCARRVVAKSEHLAKGENPRFVLPSLDGGNAKAVVFGMALEIECSLEALTGNNGLIHDRQGKPSLFEISARHLELVGDFRGIAKYTEIVYLGARAGVNAGIELDLRKFCCGG